MVNFNWNSNNLVSASQLRQASATLFGPVDDVELYGDSGKLWLFLGHTLVLRGYLSQSLLCFQSALACEPGLAGVQAIRGLVLFRLGQMEEAMAAYMAALAQDPRDAEAWLNLGVLYHSEGYLDEAASCFETAILQRPGFVAAWKNRAKVQHAQGDLLGARASFATAVSLSPSDLTLQLDHAISLMALGEFRAGWAAYEVRLHMGAEPRVQTDRWPIWQGEALVGKRLLVLAEQGLGDTLQFLRYVRDLAALGAEVIVHVPERLIPLLRGLDAECQVVTDLLADMVVDFEVPVMSLPHRLGRYEIEPAAPVQYLAADAERVRAWARRLDKGTGGLRVGIAWQGNPTFIDDAKRSFPLSTFSDLATLDGVRLINLQKDIGTEQMDAIDFPVERFGPHVDHDGAFVDTAAILENIDLLITSDSAIAHLAGAMGRPVWLALPFVADWRWGQAGETTAWYPSMRLFRQTSDSDWAGVFAEIRTALAEKPCSR